MSKLTGLLEFFPGLESLSIDQMMQWLKIPGNPTIFENELGNRVLYPQTIPLDSSGLIFDLALLREALKINPHHYYNPTLKKIFIPETFLQRFPDLGQLAWAFIETFNPEGLVTIVEKIDDIGTKNLGTYLRPEIVTKNGIVVLWVAGKKYEVKVGSLNSIPASSSRVDIKFESTAARLVGKQNFVAEVAGGALGLIVDTRI